MSNLYILTTYRKIRQDFETTRHITEYFVGIKEGDKYHEFFSNVELSKIEEQEHEYLEFNKIFISGVDHLSKHVNSSTIDKQDLFYLIVNLNASERCALDVIN